MVLYYPINVKIALAPVTWIYHLFGLGIIEYPAGQLRKVLGPLYSAMVLALFVTRFFNYRWMDLLYRNMLITDSNDIFTSFVDYLSILGTVACCIFISIVCNKKRIDCITELEQINEILTEICTTRSHRPVTMTEICQFGSMIALMMIKIIKVYLFTYKYEASFGMLWTVISSLYFSFPWLVMISAGIMHDHFNAIMTQYCKDLNSLLESMKVQHWYDRNIGEDTSVEGDIVSRETTNVEVVYSIRKVYSSLVCTGKGWNRTTAMFTLCSIIFASRVIAVKAIELNRIFKQFGILQFRGPKFIIIFSETIITIGMLVTAISSSSSLSSEANRTCGILLEHLYPIIPIRSEVRIFAMQIVQNPLRLSVYGLFSLDNSMLQEIFGIIITYVIMYEQAEKI